MKTTAAQQKAIDAEGRVLVLAGAGTGKTRTMVARCLARLFDPQDPVDLEHILMVTFTEAAAAEMKQRIGQRLREYLASSDDPGRAEEQLALLDSAKIGTLHSLAFDLIREHAHELQLSSRLRVLSSQESFRLADEAMSNVFARHYRERHGDSRKIAQLIRTATQGNDRPLRELILRLHQYAQSLPDADGWLAGQQALNDETQPVQWIEWLLADLPQWIAEWLPMLSAAADQAANLSICADSLHRLADQLKESPKSDAAVLVTIADCLKDAYATDQEWPRGKKTRLRPAFKRLYDDLTFLTSLLPTSNATTPQALEEDWARSRAWLSGLLQLTREFQTHYGQAKSRIEALDFQDLEQYTLKLLYDADRRQPSPTAQRIQQRFAYVFVDEYQDINGAQDAIIRGLSRPEPNGNLFLVGDVKQSIYRFRRANPEILKAYEADWAVPQTDRTTVYLQTNFRSRPDLLEFINTFCKSLGDQVEGFEFPEQARLEPGLSLESSRDLQEDRSVELHLLPSTTFKDAKLTSMEAEAHLIAQRLLQLKRQGQSAPNSQDEVTDPLAWSDIAILLRSVSDRPQVFARVFSHYDIPVQAAEGEFFDFPEVRDLIALLRVVDNPLEDIPLLALLHSPFFALLPSDLAIIRLARPRGPFWLALTHFLEAPEAVLPEQPSTAPSEEANGDTFPEDLRRTIQKCQRFMDAYHDWLIARRSNTIADFIDAVLATSYYLEYQSSLSPNRNPLGHVRQLTHLARDFENQPDASLTLFLAWLDELQAAGLEIESNPEEAADAVQLMSIHRSKGLEFPVVVLADLGKTFNLTDLHQPLIIDERYGLCPILHLPNTEETYPSLPHWLCQRIHHQQLLEEEARLLYVALTRAQNQLLLFGAVTDKQWNETWPEDGQDPSQTRRVRSFLDWLGPWAIKECGSGTESSTRPVSKLMRTHLHEAISLGTQGESTENRPSLVESNLTIPEPTDAAFQELVNRLDWRYPFSGATQQRAKASLSALEKRSSIGDENAPLATVQEHLPPSNSAPGAGRSIGLAYHRALQFMTPADGARIPEVRRELKRLHEDEILSDSDLEQIDPEAIHRFWTSNEGEKIRSRADYLHRELPFTARFTIGELAQLGFIVTDDEESQSEGVVVQGIVDLAVIAPDEIWLLDFKSERLAQVDIDESVARHSEQLSLYRLALRKIYQRPVTQAWIHFLQPGVTVTLPDRTE